MRICTDKGLLLAVIFNLCVFMHFPVVAASITFAWDPPSRNIDGTPLEDLAGYRIYYGTSSHNYSHHIDVGNVLTYTMEHLQPETTHYFAVTALNNAGIESDFSNEIYHFTTSDFGVDSDGDGIADDGDESGTAGDNPCTGGNRENCDDNCLDTHNVGQVDFDSDGVGDECDNCREVENQDQRDTNRDEDDDWSLDGEQHYGNACDPDYDNNGIVNIVDFNECRTHVGKPAAAGDKHCDFDGDGLIWVQDFTIWKKYYGFPPGPGVGD